MKKPPLMTPERINESIKIGRLELAASEEYRQARYHPERGGPALKALNDARAIREERDAGVKVK